MLRILMSVYLSCVLAALATPSVCAADIGAKITNFELPDISGSTHTLHSYAGRPVVLVFWSFKCPVSLAFVDRIEEFRKRYASRAVAVLGIDSASNESPAEIQANMENLKMAIPMLLDPDGDVAEKLGATHAPSVFIFDGDAVLRYRGSLDNNKKTGESGRIVHADEALDSILKGRDVAVPETAPLGCTIKRQN